MLFDLTGRRRRMVQATYLMLAVLMGGGLVFFGIGGDVQGGLADIFTGGAQGVDSVEERIEENEERVEENPNDAEARKALVQDYYQSAVALPPTAQGTIPPEGQDDLRKADANYQAYLKLTERPDSSLALLAIELYGPAALNEPEKLQEAARLRAEVENDFQSYLRLVDAATRAGDTRAADLAGEKAVQLAPKNRKEEARRAVEQTKIAAAQLPPTGEQGGAVPTPPAGGATPVPPASGGQGGGGGQAPSPFPSPSPAPEPSPSPQP